jgi:DksA/TraR C4-type zinc finger protein
MSIASRKCIRCQAAIPPERMEILPETQLCVPCSEAVGGDFESVIVSENIGKAGSLKKNYGGFSLKKRRKIEPLEGNEENGTAE